MVDIFKIKTNKPTVALERYFYLVPGVPKAGKTTLFAQFVEKYFGDIDKGLLLAAEAGYAALRVNAVDINDWDDVEDIVEQLIEYKDEIPYRFIGFDTGEIFWQYAQDKTIQEWNISHPEKRTKNINEVGAKGKSSEGYGVGYNIAKNKLQSVVNRLMKAGFGIMVITHSKDKKVEEKNGLEYDQLVCSLPNSARDIFVNMADFIVFLTIEKEKNGKDIDTKRYLYFRSDGYVEAGARFRNLPVRIEYDVDNFIETIKEAIRSEYSSESEMKQAEKEQEEEKKQSIEEFIKSGAGKHEEEPTLEDSIAKIKSLIDALEMTDDIKSALASIFKEETGSKNYTRCKDVVALQRCVERVKSL